MTISLENAVDRAIDHITCFSCHERLPIDRLVVDFSTSRIQYTCLCGHSGWRSFDATFVESGMSIDEIVVYDDTIIRYRGRQPIHRQDISSRLHIDEMIDIDDNTVMALGAIVPEPPARIRSMTNTASRSVTDVDGTLCRPCLEHESHRLGNVMQQVQREHKKLVKPTTNKRIDIEDDPTSEE